MFERLDEEGRVPGESNSVGVTFFLGREEIMCLVEMLDHKRASMRTKTEFVRHYAAKDAYPAWCEDIPDL